MSSGVMSPQLRVPRFVVPSSPRCSRRIIDRSPSPPLLTTSLAASLTTAKPGEEITGSTGLQAMHCVPPWARGCSRRAEVPGCTPAQNSVTALPLPDEWTKCTLNRDYKRQITRRHRSSSPLVNVPTDGKTVAGTSNSPVAIPQTSRAYYYKPPPPGSYLPSPKQEREVTFVPSSRKTLPPRLVTNQVRQIGSVPVLTRGAFQQPLLSWTQMANSLHAEDRASLIGTELTDCASQEPSLEAQPPQQPFPPLQPPTPRPSDSEEEEDEQQRAKENFWKAFYRRKFNKWKTVHEKALEVEMSNEVKRLEGAVEEARKRSSEEAMSQKIVHSREIQEMEESASKMLQENQRLSFLVAQLLPGEPVGEIGAGKLESVDLNSRRQSTASVDTEWASDTFSSNSSTGQVEDVLSSGLSVASEDMCGDTALAFSTNLVAPPSPVPKWTDRSLSVSECAAGSKKGSLAKLAMDMGWAM